MFKLRTAVGAACLFLGLRAVAATSASFFGTDAEGWSGTTTPDYGPFNTHGTAGSVTWDGGIGNPAPSILLGDLDGATTWFEAPAKFLGNQSLSYGLSLGYDILPTTVIDWTDAPLVVLAGGGNVMVWSGVNPTINVWNNYSVLLSETFSGWHLNGLAGAAPTASQFQTTLANLTELRIREEYTYGSDATYLDNVVLNSRSVGVPDGGATALLTGLGALSLLAMRRRPA